MTLDKSTTTDQSRWFSRLLVFTLVGAAALAGGIYVGTATLRSGSLPPIAPHDPATIEPELALNIAVGDRFPDEPALDRHGRQTNLGDYLDGHPTIIFFSAVGCDACSDLFALWDAYMPPLLHDGIHEIVCYGKEEFNLMVEQPRFVADRTLLFIDGYYFRDTYNRRAFPTIVGLDENGLVTHIQYAYSRYLDQEWLEFYTDADVSSIIIQAP